MSPLSIEPESHASKAGTNTTTLGTLTLIEEVVFATYFFSCNKVPIDMNMPVFFLGKCLQTAAKTMVVDRKNQKALAAKCCELKRCADRVSSRTDNKNKVLEGKFRNLNFCLPPKRQLSILLNFFFPFIDI